MSNITMGHFDPLGIKGLSFLKKKNILGYSSHYLTLKLSSFSSESAQIWQVP